MGSLLLWGVGYSAAAIAAAPVAGTVWAWGHNGSGQLGDGTTTNRFSPVRVGGLLGVVAIAGSGHHSLSLKSDGTVWAWGRNRRGQLGDGSTTARLTPVQVSGLTGVVAVAVDSGSCDGHSLAVKSDGTVLAWGSNWRGELGDGTQNNALTPAQVSGLTGAVAIAGGCRYSLALKSDGTVWAWGDNLNGQLGDGTRNRALTPVQVSGLTGVIAIASGSLWGMALKSDGTVWAWGDNYYGSIGDGTQNRALTPVQVIDPADPTGYLSAVTGISGGGAVHSLAVKSDGTVWAWGRNAGGLGDGSISIYPHKRFTPAQVVDPADSTGYLTGVVAVEAGRDNSLALKSDGTVWAWGRNEGGQLGDGTSYNLRLTPVQVVDPADSTGYLTGVIALAVGYSHSLAIVASHGIDLLPTAITADLVRQ